MVELTRHPPPVQFVVSAVVCADDRSVERYTYIRFSNASVAIAPINEIEIIHRLIESAGQRKSFPSTHFAVITGHISYRFSSSDTWLEGEMKSNLIRIQNEPNSNYCTSRVNTVIQSFIIKLLLLLEILKKFEFNDFAIPQIHSTAQWLLSFSFSAFFWQPTSSYFR